MHVFLDTNILYDKFKLDNSVISGLKTYLQFTKSKAYLSAVSFKEIVFKYKERLKELKMDVLEKDFNSLNYHKKHDFTGLNEKIEKLGEEYEEFLKAQLKWRCEIVKIDESFMEECVDRAVCKKPPCGKKEEFRDTVIWLTYAQMINEGSKPIAFITNNTKDFWKELNPVLLDDIMEAKRKNMVYRNSLEQFLEEYYDTLKWFVDYDYIAKNILTEEFCLDLFEKEKDNVDIEDYVYNKDDDVEFTRTDRVGFRNLSWLFIKDKIFNKGKEYYVISITIEYEAWLEAFDQTTSIVKVSSWEYITIELKFNKEDKILSFAGVSNHYLSELDWQWLLNAMEDDQYYNKDEEPDDLPDWFPFK